MELTQSVGLGRTGTRAAMRASAWAARPGWMGGGSGEPGRGPACGSRSPMHAPQLVKQCNEGAHKMERTEQMYTLHTQLDFSKVKVGAPPVPPRPCSEVRGHRPQAAGCRQASGGDPHPHCEAWD